MAKFTCKGFQSVNAHNAREAAYIFGNRLARRHRLGRCRDVHFDSYARNAANFEIILGKSDTALGLRVYLTITEGK